MHELVKNPNSCICGIRIVLDSVLKNVEYNPQNNSLFTIKYSLMKLE